ncbi:ABC transporter ATP-binding protein [Halococcus qingdaonensis]|uniref:ABC transporter ATP-binding protein n=1 Tax=Halococcus qingdaonensis TaxID=224402 RepID=UPI002116CDBB|nr:ABC transporter ATP-binding protein [Halococcus qingdaonensis]
MASLALDATDIGVTRGTEAILHDVSIAVPSDGRTLVQGPSGAGKTTLFDVLGLLDRPTSGTLTIQETATDALSESERARLRRETLGFVFQEFQLVADLTAWENAALPQDHTGERDADWLGMLFDELAIADLAEQYPATLSGGEKQRVAIARALANRPAIVLADEPTGQLDPDTADRVLELLLDIHETAETALLTISHDRRLRSAFDEIVALENGTTVPTSGDPA